uniref:Uncharacterized protein n=1 Tax=Romanomermis culicivorax TaxID=13658 RepID=A0A915KQR0_ROMCU
MTFEFILAISLCLIPGYEAACLKHDEYMPGATESMRICQVPFMDGSCSSRFCIPKNLAGRPACCAHSCLCSDRPQ